MKVLKKIGIEETILFFLFLVMLWINVMSPLCIDDFTHALSFATHERITNFAELAESIRAYSINGKVIPVFIIQLCLIYPKVIFNILNSLIFICQIVLMRRLCCFDGKKNWKIVIGAIGLIWCFIPAFGEDYLWLTAAIVYSWGATLSLLFTYYFSRHIHKGEKYSLIKQICICLLAFFLGAYSETTSIISLAVPLIYCVILKVIYKRKIMLWMILSGIFGGSGLLFLITRPGQHIKVNTNYLTNLAVSKIRYTDAFGLVLIFWGVFIIFTFVIIKVKSKKYSIQKFIDTIIYMFLSLAISGGMIIASTYPERVMLLTGIYLFLAVLSFGYATRDIINYETKIWNLCGIAVIIGTICVIFNGIYEIYDYKQGINIMYTEIEEQIEMGKTDIVISECPEYDSKYINYNECPYFGTDPKNYVNDCFMRYIGYNGTIRVEE